MEEVEITFGLFSCGGAKPHILKATKKNRCRLFRSCFLFLHGLLFCVWVLLAADTSYQAADNSDGKQEQGDKNANSQR
jgi:hypothetical protein